MLIRGERITFVGSQAEARRQASAAVRQIDLRGMDEGQIVDFLKEVYRDAKAGETLYAWGWDYPSCPRPHRIILDGAFPDNPVVLIQFSGHGSWVNSRVLEKFRIGAAEALRAYTLGSAYAEFQESQKGSITAGKLADLAILSGDLLSVKPETIKDIEVQMTIPGGRIVYQKNNP